MRRGWMGEGDGGMGKKRGRTPITVRKGKEREESKEYRQREEEQRRKGGIKGGT